MLNTNSFSLPPGPAALTAAGAFTITGATSNGGAVNIGYSYDPSAANLDFLLQAEGGIRAHCVTVVHTCALPISQNVTFTITGTNDAPILSDTTDPTAV